MIKNLLEKVAHKEWEEHEKDPQPKVYLSTILIPSFYFMIGCDKYIPYVRKKTGLVLEWFNGFLMLFMFKSSVAIFTKEETYENVDLTDD